MMLYKLDYKTDCLLSILVFVFKWKLSHDA